MATISKKSKPSQRSRGARPAKGHGTTIAARADSFAQSSAAGEKHTGLKAPGQGSPWPFKDLATKDHYRGYDTLAQSRIALSLAAPAVMAKANFHNVGTGSELHVIGRFLQLGYVWEHSVFFQEATLLDFRRTRAFVADVAIRPQGQGLVLMPIDGQAFHAKTYAEVLDGNARDRALGRLGRVVTIPDTACYQGQELDTFLNQHGVS